MMIQYTYISTPFCCKLRSYKMRQTVSSLAFVSILFFFLMFCYNFARLCYDWYACIAIKKYAYGRNFGWPVMFVDNYASYTVLRIFLRGLNLFGYCFLHVKLCILMFLAN